MSLTQRVQVPNNQVVRSVIKVIIVHVLGKYVIIKHLEP